MHYENVGKFSESDIIIISVSSEATTDYHCTALLSQSVHFRNPYQYNFNTTVWLSTMELTTMELTTMELTTMELTTIGFVC